MYVNVVFVIKRVYSAVSLTLVREQRFIRIIIRSIITKVTKRVAMPARFVTNEVVTNRAGIAPFFLSLGYQYM